MEYSIVYSSNTGNTAMLAEIIREQVGSEKCKYFGSVDPKGKDTTLIFVGFWTDKGTCDEKMEEFLKSLRDKKVFIFGTAGFGGSEEYYSRILKSVEKNLDVSNNIVGTYMCQGKMPMGVRERYVQLQKEDPNNKRYEMLIKNFDQALSHPDQMDFEQLKKALFVLESNSASSC